MTGSFNPRFHKPEIKVNQYCQWDGNPVGRGLDEMVTVFAASRDVGCYVLPFLMEFCPDGMALWTDEYSLNIPPEGSWQIQGVFTIDFDAQTVAISFNGDTSWSISFDALANKTDKSIEDEMVQLEKRIEEKE